MLSCFSTPFFALGFAVFLAGSSAVKAEEKEVQSPPNGETSKAFIQENETQSLLPATMGPMEKLLWSEHGWARGWYGLPLDTEHRKDELKLRRSLFNAHQTFGFVTLGLLATTVVFGQLTLNGNEDYGDVHKPLAYALGASYLTTAVLAMLTPPPIQRKGGFNTITLHKGLAIIHFTGMIATPILAVLAGDESEKNGNEKDRTSSLWLAHQVSGYTTLAALTTAMLVVTF